MSCSQNFQADSHLQAFKFQKTLCRSSRLAKARELKEKQRKLLEEATRLALEVETPEELAELDAIFNSPLPADAATRLQGETADSALPREVS